jgi:hypothetical protein
MKTYSSLHTTLLARLAQLVSDIDDFKRTEPQLINYTLHAARGVIGEMKMELLDIGQLDQIFERMHWAPDDLSDPTTLLAFIEAAHEEIMRLLGDDQPLIYCPADEEEPCHA